MTWLIDQIGEVLVAAQVIGHEKLRLGFLEQAHELLEQLIVRLHHALRFPDARSSKRLVISARDGMSFSLRR